MCNKLFRLQKVIDLRTGAKRNDALLKLVDTNHANKTTQFTFVVRVKAVSVIDSPRLYFLVWKILNVRRGIYNNDALSRMFLDGEGKHRVELPYAPNTIQVRVREKYEDVFAA